MTGPIPHFEAITGVQPYPWQQRCYEELLDGAVASELTLPTGTGKTSFILLYLLALARGAELPRRLVYVVDRRAIVDQTVSRVHEWIDALSEVSEVHRALTAMAAFSRPDAPPVALGSLRGGLTDTGEWRLDPAKPAVIVGTVDIVGSRLLFAGYGDGRSRRSLHAGLLGIDTTVVLDESHLSPGFARTLRDLERLHTEEQGAQFKAVTMSATPRDSSTTSLEEADEAHPELGVRLQAPKHPILHQVDGATARRQRMMELATVHRQGAVLLFMKSAQEAQRLHADLARALGRGGDARVGLLTGTLRGAERQRLMESTLWRRFSDPEPEDASGEPVFLVATAAGEVGVDLDADHAVMDLAPLDSMIQRLGRINRTGRRPDSVVDIVYTPQDIAFKEGNDTWKHRFGAACERTLSLLQGLPRLAPTDLLRLPFSQMVRASVPAPRIVPLEEARVALLAATSATMDIPPVAPYLRGVTDEPDPAEVQILWRADVLLLLSKGLAAAKEAMSMLPPRPREVLKVPAYVAAAELPRLAERYGAFRCLCLGADGDASEVEITRDTQSLVRVLGYSTLVLPAEVGGLSEAGFLEPKAAGRPVSDLADDEEALRFEQQGDQDKAELPGWVSRAVQWRIALHDEDDEEAEPRWWVYVRRQPGDLALDTDSDLTRLAREPQRLADHNAWVGHAARQIGQALGLDQWIVAALEDAGARHDDGKASRIWQWAAGNRGSEPIAKSHKGRFQPGMLGGYRHEFGSLGRAERELPGSQDKPDLGRDLVLHLIAAHHGHARPGFPHRHQWDPELPDGQAESLALAVERRYARLQAHFGYWGLAWLEALLKCADAWVSSGYALRETDSGRALSG